MSIRDYPDDFIQCKAWFHPWDTEYVPEQGEFRKPEFGMRVVHLCTHCGALRHRLMARDTGSYLDTTWNYRYTEGFKPDEAHTKADFRAEYERRRRARARNGAS